MAESSAVGDEPRLVDGHWFNPADETWWDEQDQRWSPLPPAQIARIRAARAADVAPESIDGVPFHRPTGLWLHPDGLWRYLAPAQYQQELKRRHAAEARAQKAASGPRAEVDGPAPPPNWDMPDPLRGVLAGEDSAMCRAARRTARVASQRKPRQRSTWKPRVLLAGYQGRRPSDLAYIARRDQLLIVDVRIRPTSQQPGWSRPDLQALLGNDYMACPEWGNSARFDRGAKSATIEIADFEGGWRRLAHSASSRSAILLLCACRSPEGCHRSVLGSQLQGRVESVTEFTWT